MIELFVTAMDEVGREFDMMTLLSPETANRELMADIYKFFIDKP